MYIFVRARSDPIEFVQVGLLDLVQYSFVVVAVIALAGRIDLFFRAASRSVSETWLLPASAPVGTRTFTLREPSGVRSLPLT